MDSKLFVRNPVGSARSPSRPARASRPSTCRARQSCGGLSSVRSMPGPQADRAPVSGEHRPDLRGHRVTAVVRLNDRGCDAARRHDHGRVPRVSGNLTPGSSSDRRGHGPQVRRDIGGNDAKWTRGIREGYGPRQRVARLEGHPIPTLKEWADEMGVPAGSCRFIKNSVGLPFIGSYGTIYASSGSLALMLMERPNVLEQLRDPDLLGTGIGEFARFDGPTQATSRVATPATEIRASRSSRATRCSPSSPPRTAIRPGSPRPQEPRARPHPEQAPRLRMGPPLVHRVAVRPARPPAAGPRPADAPAPLRLTDARSGSLGLRCAAPPRSPSRSRCEDGGRDAAAGSHPGLGLPARGRTEHRPRMLVS